MLRLLKLVGRGGIVQDVTISGSGDLVLVIFALRFEFVFIFGEATLARPAAACMRWRSRVIVVV